MRNGFFSPDSTLHRYLTTTNASCLAALCQGNMSNQERIYYSFIDRELTCRHCTTAETWRTETLYQAILVAHVLKIHTNCQCNNAPTISSRAEISNATTSGTRKHRLVLYTCISYNWLYWSFLPAKITHHHDAREIMNVVTDLYFYTAVVVEPQAEFSFNHRQSWQSFAYFLANPKKQHIMRTLRPRISCSYQFLAKLKNRVPVVINLRSKFRAIFFNFDIFYF